jgi:hypothetical protein
VAKVRDRDYGLLGQIAIRIARSLRIVYLYNWILQVSLRVLLGAVFTFATATDCALLCPYAGSVYSIALAIVYFNGTLTLSHYTITKELSTKLIYNLRTMCCIAMQLGQLNRVY